MIQRAGDNFRRSLLEGGSACWSSEKLPLSWQQNEVFLYSKIILTETEEQLSVGSPIQLLTVVALWIKMLGREKEIPWGKKSALILLLLGLGVSNTEVSGLQSPM